MNFKSMLLASVLVLALGVITTMMSCAMTRCWRRWWGRVTQAESVVCRRETEAKRWRARAR